MRWAWLVFLLVVSSVVAVPPVTQLSPEDTLTVVYPANPVYKVGNNLTLKYHVYNVSGYRMTNVTTGCAVSVCGPGCDDSQLMTLRFNASQEFFYTYYDATNESGTQSFAVYCNGSRGAGYVSSSFVLTNDGRDDEPDAFLAALILLPLLFGLVLVVGAVSVKQQPVLQAFLLMISFVPVLSGLHFGLVAVIKFYDWPVMQDAIGTTTWWMSMVLFAVLAYWLIYLVALMFHVAAQKKKKVEY